MRVLRVVGIVALAVVSITFAVAQTPMPRAENAEKLDPDQIAQIIEKFERAPLSESYWVQQRWAQVSDARWLPALQKLAVRDRFPETWKIRIRP
jgi:hypothetical protein